MKSDMVLGVIPPAKKGAGGGGKMETDHDGMLACAFPQLVFLEGLRKLCDANRCRLL